MTSNKLNTDYSNFCDLISNLNHKQKGGFFLKNCTGKQQWVQKGLYIFLSKNHHFKTMPRVTRVGTHAVSDGSKTTLWKRLSQHKGNANDGAGNHRGSIFRLLVGQALIARDGLVYEHWGKGSNAPRNIRESEKYLEQYVSKEIGEMPFLFIEINDEASKNSMRSYIEKNSIGLVSAYNLANGFDEPDWLGLYSNRERVRNSGMWNNNYVGEGYEAEFLDVLDEFIETM